MNAHTTTPLQEQTTPHPYSNNHNIPLQSQHHAPTVINTAHPTPHPCTGYNTTENPKTIHITRSYTKITTLPPKTLQQLRHTTPSQPYSNIQRDTTTRPLIAQQREWQVVTDVRLLCLNYYCCIPSCYLKKCPQGLSSDHIFSIFLVRNTV